MNFLLEITKDDYGTKDLISQFGFGEVTLFGGKMLLIGIAIIFVVLSLIWACLSLFKIFFHDLPAKRKVASTPVTTAQETQSIDTSATDNEEVVAVIAAAIAAAESQNEGAKFRVVSFRRV